MTEDVQPYGAESAGMRPLSGYPRMWPVRYGKRLLWIQDSEGETTCSIDVRGVESVKLTMHDGGVHCAKTPREAGRWQSTPPKEHGWYWWRESAEKPRPQIVKCLGPEAGSELCPMFDNENYVRGCGEWWSEPIAEPPA